MASSQSGQFSTATPHTNPFLTDADDAHKTTSNVTLQPDVQHTLDTLSRASNDPRATAAPGIGSLDSSRVATGSSTSSSIGTSTAGQTDAKAALNQTAADAQVKAQQAGNTLAANAQAAVENVQQRFQNLETKENLAGDLAPSERQVQPETVPAGTEHVTNILSSVGGAIFSAPAAALEAISPVAASKLSDATAAVSARLPTAADAQATASNLANSAYNAIPEGTAETLKGYTGAAVQKAQEVLPPALGGSTTTGNTGTGETAKPPSQLASEYGNAAAQSTSQAANNATATASAYATAAGDKLAELAGLAKQNTAAAAETAKQNTASAAETVRQNTASAAESARQTTASAAGTVQQQASDLSASAQQTASANAPSYSSTGTAPNRLADLPPAHTNNTASGAYEYTNVSDNARDIPGSSFTNIDAAPRS